MKLDIWDTEGESSAAQRIQNFYHGSHIFVIVYSIESGTTYKSISNFIEGVDNLCGKSSIKVIVGHKCDLNNNRKVKLIDLADKAEEHNVDLFFETSALPEYKGTIDTLFNAIIDRLSTPFKDATRTNIKPKA